MAKRSLLSERRLNKIKYAVYSTISYTVYPSSYVTCKLEGDMVNFEEFFSKYKKKTFDPINGKRFRVIPQIIWNNLIRVAASTVGRYY